MSFEVRGKSRNQEAGLLTMNSRSDTRREELDYGQIRATCPVCHSVVEMIRLGVEDVCPSRACAHGGVFFDEKLTRAFALLSFRRECSNTSSRYSPLSWTWFEHTRYGVPNQLTCGQKADNVLLPQFQVGFILAVVDQSDAEKFWQHVSFSTWPNSYGS